MSSPAQSVLRRRIRVLDPMLANQIAAGEVVERPASVLKELMENALDAGATRIQVHAERGGMACLNVRDDGGGIHHDDLRLALERHATSKVATLQELESVATLGFRGEALPSIAAVSRMVITSRTGESSDAWSISLPGEAGELLPRPAAHPAGTTVEVRDLFFNTPARRRFLRTERTELRHLEQVFKRLALSRMDVAMNFSHNEREVLRLPRAATAIARLERARRIARAGYMSDVAELCVRRDELELEGWVQRSQDSATRPDQQYLFLNARAIVDATVRHAVRLAYGERLPHGQHPGWILFLRMPVSEVDVNVHPTKQEVRFHDARRVHDFVRFAVRHALDEREAPRTAPPAVSGPRASAPSAVREPAESPQPSSLTALVLLAGGVLVARDGDDLLLANVPALVAGCARERLHRALAGDSPRARPLLIPERFSWALDEGAFQRMAHALAPLAVTVRAIAPGVGALQTLPQCLEAVPAASICERLAAPPDALTSSADWIEHLLVAARAATVRDAGDALGMLDFLRARTDGESPTGWRRITPQAAARLIDEA